MASIETSIDLMRQLSIHTVTGEITFLEIVEAVSKYYQGTITQLLLWDFTHASMTQTTSEQIRQLVDLSRPFTSRRKGGKTAFLFATEVDFGIGRMYEIQVSGLDKSVSHRAFRDKESALKWLLS